MKLPSHQELELALSAAGAAHHEYQTNALNGKHDELWAGWYAGYVLGRLGDFATPTELASLLASVTGDGDWTEAAARKVLEGLS